MVTCAALSGIILLGKKTSLKQNVKVNRAVQLLYQYSMQRKQVLFPFPNPAAFKESNRLLPSHDGTFTMRRILELFIAGIPIAVLSQQLLHLKTYILPSPITTSYTHKHIVWQQLYKVLGVFRLLFYVYSRIKMLSLSEKYSPIL